MIDLLKRTLDAHRDEYLKPLLDLGRLDTHCLGHGIDGGLEKAGQDYIAKLMGDMGAEVRVVPMKEEDIQTAIEKYHDGNPGHNYDDRANVYGRFAGGGGRSIMFNGHMDTMPAQAELWATDPWTPTLKDGKLYGLGIADMKSGLAAAVMAVKLLRDAGLELPGDVIITSVADEEGGGNGSIAAAIQGEKADAVVVCEGTNYELIAAHMGFVFFRVEVEGVAVHSGIKWKGVSAIAKAMKLIEALDELEHKWLLQYKHPLLPAPNLNVGTIHGGTAGSTTAARCTFELCIHYLPEQMSYEQVVGEVNAALDYACRGDEWLDGHRPKTTIYQSGNAFEMDLEHPFTKAFEAAWEASHGRPVPVVGSPSGCDSRTWRNIAGCPTLQYGPGELSQCHSVDELIDLDMYYDAILTYAALILEWAKS